MDRKAFFLIGLLLLGAVTAQEVVMPISASVTTSDVQIDVPPEAQAQAAMIPSEIPADVVNAHAEVEFLELVCAMARYNMQRFIDGSITVKQHFDSMVTDVQSVMPELALDTSVVNEVSTDMTVRLNALCEATVETYPTAIKGIVELAMGNEGAQVKLKGLGEELSTQLEAKGAEYQSQATALQTQASTALGGMSVEEMQTLATQVESKTAEINALQARLQGGDPSVNPSQIESLVNQINTLTGQMPSEETKAQAEAFKVEAESFRTEAQAFGEKVQSVFGNVQEKMESAFAQKDYSDLKALANEKWYALFLKVFNANTVDIGSLRAEFTSYGIDTTPIDDVEAWIASKKEEAKSVFNADATEAEISLWIEELQAESEEKQRVVTQLIEQQVSDKWISGFEELKAKADTSLAQAESAGLDTTEVRSIIAQLESIKTEAHDLIVAEDRNSALDKIKEAEALMPSLQSAYTALQAQGEDARASAEQAAAQLEAQKPKIEALINAAQEAGLDTSVIMALTDEMNSIYDSAQNALGQEDNALALQLLNEAKSKYNQVRVEFERLKGELQ